MRGVLRVGGGIGPYGAITFGNVEIFTGPSDQVNPSSVVPTYDQSSTVVIGNHEEGHTYQAQALGPLFFPAYIAAGMSYGRSMNPVNGLNPFELSADNFGKGLGGPFSGFR
jgi:hypothetical protein